MSLHAVILAGGSGTRFWPLSRVKKPKQFLALATGNTLIAETAARVEPMGAQVWVVCGKDHANGVRQALPSLPAEHLIVEPAAKNTAPAIALACRAVLREDPKAVMMVLPSDHHIARPDAFREALQAAARSCEGGDLVTIGIKPTRAETGYGYLRRGSARKDGSFAVEAFVEKPNAETAERYLRDPAFSWNAGIFVFRADAMLAALKRHTPKIVDALDDFAEARSDGLTKVPSISIDYGVMEPQSKEGGIALVPGDFGWSDVGSFAAIPEVRKLDDRGNAVSGDALVIDSDECVVMSEGGRLVATVGLKGLCVIDAGDAILVVPRDRAQDVRAAVDALKSANRTDKL